MGNRSEKTEGEGKSRRVRERDPERTLKEQRWAVIAGWHFRASTV